MNNEVITHDGVVKTIDGQHLCVTILQSAACGGCAARKLCSSAEAKEKEVDVFTPRAAEYRVGQKVVLEGRLTDGRLAAMIAYGLPLVLLLLALVAGIKLTGSETVGALCALIALALYYSIIFLFFRSWLQRRFSFRIQH